MALSRRAVFGGTNMLRLLLLSRCGLAAASVSLCLAGLSAQSEAAPPTCRGANIAESMSRENSAGWARVNAAAGATTNANALLWRIEKPRLAPSYLFGTIHLTDDRVANLSPATDSALRSAKIVALEIADLSPAALAPALAALQHLLVYGDGRSLERQLTDEEQKKSHKVLEGAGMPPAVLALLRPWFVGMLMAVSDCERQRRAAGLIPLDAQLGETAKSLGIPVMGLETVADQLHAMARVPENDQIVMLKASLKLYDRTDALIETMITLYKSRAIGKLWPLQEELWREAGFNPASLTAFQREVVTVRNGKMRDAAKPVLEKGGAFIAVGALHLPGPTGLVEQFRKIGYTVTAVE